MNLTKCTTCLCWTIASVCKERNLNYFPKRGCFYIKTSVIIPHCKPKIRSAPLSACTVNLSSVKLNNIVAVSFNNEV